MALSEYQGPSNKADIFQHLVGEKIVACFEHERRVWFVVESGHALVVGGSGSPPSGSVYWRESPEKVQRIVRQRREEIEIKLREMRDMAGVSLP